MAPKKKKTSKDDVDLKILRKIKEPTVDPIDLEDEEPGEEIVIDDEKTTEPEEENY